jgi:hypothetical protein
MELLKSQRNTVGQIIVNRGLNIQEFVWSATPTSVIQVGLGQEPITVSTLVHGPTGFYFVFDFDSVRNHHCNFRPGLDSPEERHGPHNWGVQAQYVHTWLGYVKREHEAPDLWQALQGGFAELPSEVENTAFRPEEQVLIEQQLRAALEAIQRTHELTAAQLQALEEKVEYLVEAAGRFPRLDWRSLLLGSLFEVMISQSLAPDVVRDMLSLVLRGLAQLFGGPELPALP